MDATRRLPQAVLIGSGIGTLGPVIVLTSVNTLLLRFLTDHVGIAAGVAATLLAVSKLLAVFADPTVGVLSDGAETRFGRRTPFLVGGGILLTAALVSLFWVPPFAGNGARAAYVLAVLCLYTLAYAIFNVPYLAMAAEIAGDYHERSVLMSYRVVAVGISQLVAAFVGPLLLVRYGGDAWAHTAMAMSLAPIVLLSSLACASLTYGTSRAIYAAVPSTPPRGGWRRLASILSNRPYLALLAAKFLTLMTLGVKSVFPFFFQRILHVSDAMLGSYYLASALALIASQPLWVWVSRRIGKRATFMIGLALLSVSTLWWFFAQAGEWQGLIFLRGLAYGFASGAAILMGQAMLPDTIEYDMHRVGRLRAGLLTGFYTTVEKVSGAAGVALIGLILATAGYIEARGLVVVQPQAAIDAIRWSASLIPAALCGAALLALTAYNIDEDTLAQLRVDQALEEPDANPVRTAGRWTGSNSCPSS